MDYINNRGEKIGSLTHAVSSNTSITINRIHDVTIVSTRDRNTGEVTTETFIGDSPYGKERTQQVVSKYLPDSQILVLTAAILNKHRGLFNYVEGFF